MRKLWLAVWLGLLAAAPAQADPITIAVMITGSALLEVALYAAVFLIGTYQKKKAARKARDAYNASLQDRLVMAPIANGPRQRVYGRLRVSGGVVFKWAHGTANDTYTLLVSLAGHQVQAIGDVYVADKKVTLDANGWVQDAPYLRTDRSTVKATSTANASGVASITLPGTYVGGTVQAYYSYGEASDSGGADLAVSISGSTATAEAPEGTVVQWTWQQTSGTSYVRVRKFLGGPSQDLHSYFAGHPEVGAADKFAGDACLLIDMVYSQDAFPNGVPAFSAVVDGARVFDPRTSATAWTQNPALIARDWALHANGGGLQASQLDEESFIAAANVCDVSHTFSVAGTNVTDKLYRCGISIPMEGSPTPWLEEICESMAGAHAWPGGRLAVVAGAWRAPVASINEDWLAGTGDVQIIPEPGLEQLANSITPSIADEAKDWLEQQVPAVAPAAYLAADGQELGRDLQMMGVQTAYHAQHIAGVLLRAERMAGSIVLHCKFIAFQLEVFDVVTLYLEEFGYTGQTFEVQDTTLTMDGGVQLTLRRTAASVFDPDATFTLPTFADRTSLPDPTVVAQVQGLGVSSGTAPLSDGSILVRTAVEWDAVADAGVRLGGSVELQYIEVVASPTELASDNWPQWIEPGGSTGAVIPGLRAGAAYIFRARGINGAGVRGPWSTQQTHIVAGAPVASLRADLSLPAAVVQADAAGAVASFAAAGGEMRVYSNTTRLTTGVTYSVASAANCTVAINSAGAYTVSAMAADTATATLRAVVLGQTFDLPYTLTKARKGVDGAGNVTWTTRGGVVMNGTTATKVSGSPATFDGEVASVQGFAGGCYVSFNAAQTDSAFMVGLNSDPTTAPDYQSIDYAIYCQGSGNAYIYENGSEVLSFGVYTVSDRFEIRHSGGFVKYYKNGAAIRSVALSDSAVLYADASFYNVGAAANNLVFGPVGAQGPQGSQGPQGLPGADGADGADGSDGASAPLLVLLATAQTFAYDSAGSPKPAGQTITLTAALQNVSGTATFTARKYNAAGADIGALTLGGSGNTRTIAEADFSGAASASITATLGSLSDTTTVVRVQDGANGSNGSDAVVSDLSNDSHTLPATSAGVVTTYSGAATAMTVYEGASVGTGWSFSRTDGPNVTSTISGNTVTITSLATSADSGYVDITATKSGFPTQTKRFTLSKSKSAAGTSGPIVGVTIYAEDVDDTSPYSMSASVSFNANGTWVATAPGGGQTTGFWYSPQTTAIGSSYWIKFEVNYTVGGGVGTTFTGTTGSIVSLASGQTLTLAGPNNCQKSIKYFVYSDSSGSTISSVGFIEIYNSIGGV